MGMDKDIIIGMLTVVFIIVIAILAASVLIAIARRVAHAGQDRQSKMRKETLKGVQADRWVDPGFFPQANRTPAPPPYGNSLDYFLYLMGSEGRASVEGLSAFDLIEVLRKRVSALLDPTHATTSDKHYIRQIQRVQGIRKVLMMLETEYKRLMEEKK